MLTLDSASLHEPLRVCRIAQPSARSRCRELGVYEGSHVACAARSAHFVLLETASGLDVLLSRHDAALIDVELLDAAPRTRRVLVA